MKTLFQNMDTLDPCLVRRVVDLLSYHLSNNMWRWPWQSWGRVLEVRFVLVFIFTPLHNIICTNVWCQLAPAVLGLRPAGAHPLPCLE